MNLLKCWVSIWVLIFSQWGIALATSSEKVKWYDVEEATIHFDVKGSQTGKIIRHFKDWGNIQVEINQTQMNVMGMSIPTNQKTITEGEWVTSIDLNSKTLTRIKNPMYASIRKKMRGKSGVEARKAFVTAMGYRDTGKTAKYAGEKCNIWEMAQMGSLMCITKDRLTIWVHTNIGGMQVTHIATLVKRGDPGPKEAYEISEDLETKPTQDISEIMKMLKQSPRPPKGTVEPASANPSTVEEPLDMKKLKEMFKQSGGQ